MTDYLLRFPSREYAIAFGRANGFTATDPKTGEDVSSLASHTHALIVIGEHSVPTGEVVETEFGAQPLLIGDGLWWVLFRDLVGISIPDAALPIIAWRSDNGDRPSSPDVPQHAFA